MMLGNLPYNRVPVLAKRHKIDTEKNGASPHELLAKQVSTLDESGLCRLLLEVSLIESAYATSGKSDNDSLLNTAQGYRVDAEKVAEGGRPRIRRQAKEEGAEGKTKERGVDGSIQIIIGGRGRELSAFTLCADANLCGFTQRHLSG